MTEPVQQGNPSIYSAEHALRQTVEQAVSLIDAAASGRDPEGKLVPTLRRVLRGGLIAADALNGANDD